MKCDFCGIELVNWVCYDCGREYCSSGLEGAIEDVKDFHRAMHQPIHGELTTPSDERVRLRANLILEECMETVDGMFEPAQRHTPWDEVEFRKVNVDYVKLADGLADLIYVCVGAANEFGIDLAAVWDEVHKSNMAKIGPNGEVKRRVDGKVIKPDGWTPPDIKKALGIK